MINNKKKAVLHVAKSQLGLDDDLYRDILEQEAGVRTSKRLNNHKFKKVMNRFEKMGFRSSNYKKPKKRKRKNIPDAMLSPEMQGFIDKLYNKLGWEEHKRRVGFNRRQIGKPWPQTRAEANKIIEGLKAMIKRGYNKGRD